MHTIAATGIVQHPRKIVTINSTNVTFVRVLVTTTTSSRNSSVKNSLVSTIKLLMNLVATLLNLHEKMAASAVHPRMLRKSMLIFQASLVLISIPKDD